MFFNLGNVIILTLIWMSSWYFVTKIRYILEDEEVEGFWGTLMLFVQEVMCHSPRGEIYRIFYVRSELDKGYESDFIGDTKYSYEEVERLYLHDEVYFRMKVGHRFFWMREIVVILFGPVIVLIGLALIILNYLMNLWDRASYQHRQVRIKSTAS